MDRPQINAIFEEHLTWVLTAGKSGKQAGYANADISEANLHGRTLQGARFNQAICHRTHFIRAELAGADFSSAVLTNAFFHRANVSGAKFNGANLQGAEFNHADLRGADLSGADLRDADFHKAKFDATTKLDGAILEGALGLPRTAA